MKNLTSLSSFSESALSYAQQGQIFGGVMTEESEISRTATTPTNGCSADETVVSSYDCHERTMTTYTGCCE